MQGGVVALITLNEVQQAVNAKGLSLVEADYSGTAATIEFASDQPNAIDKYLDLAIGLGVKSLYLKVVYFTREQLDKFLIPTEDITEQTYGSAYSQVKLEALQLNKKIKAINPRLPASISLFLFHGGAFYVLSYPEPWMKLLAEPADIFDYI